MRPEGSPLGGYPLIFMKTKAKSWLALGRASVEVSEEDGVRSLHLGGDASRVRSGSTGRMIWRSTTRAR